jgi:hypothetical protein
MHSTQHTQRILRNTPDYKKANQSIVNSAYAPKKQQNQARDIVTDNNINDEQFVFTFTQTFVRTIANVRLPQLNIEL